MTVEYANRLREIISDAILPPDLSDFIHPAEGTLGNLLDKLYYTEYATSISPRGLSFVIELVIPGEMALSLPGLDSLQIVIGSGGEDATVVTASLFVGSDDFEFRLDDITLALRFPPSILKPVPPSPGVAAPPYAQIETHGSILLDHNFDLSLEDFSGLSLKPAMIGNSGVVISADGVKLDLSRTSTLPEITAAGFDESFMGIYIGEAKVQLPKEWPAIVPQDLVLRKCAIGSGGVSGELIARYTPTYNPDTKEFTGDGAGKLFGIPFGLEEVSLKFKQNTFQESKMTGQLLLPFFDKRLGVEIGLSLDGSFAVKLASAVESGDSMNGGLLTLSKPGLLDLIIESLSFQVQDGVFTAKLSGKTIPHVGNLGWPSFQVKELVIDSDGNVRLEGGWLDLPNHYSLDFYGFQMEITKLGFGQTQDGGKWIGFSGALKLVDGLPAGASVEGLRIIWYDDPTQTKITLNGVGVEFEVPEVLRFKGAVSWKGDHFDGAIKLDLISLDFQVDGTLVIGEQARIPYFALYLSVDLPAGIPLFATGLALYGMEGFFALQMGPNKGANEEWYENADGSPGWYKRTPIGVTQLTGPGRKWEPQPDSLALGAGVTLGTVSDNGYVFSGRMLLLLLFPGPVLLIQGKANLLKERAKLDGEDPLFRALAVLDNRAGTFLIGLDAQYKYDSTGKLIDIRGSAETFFSLSDASLWHLYLGKKDPREKRIRAQLLSIFEANAYLMLDAHQLATGAWLGYDKHWEFGPLGVTLQAWIDGNAVISWKPVHFHGDLWLHGKAELHVFWIDLGMTVDARFAADVFDPFHIRAGFSVCVSLPWPFDDICADITLEWSDPPTPPPLPLPLKEIAVEHLKVTESWPLQRDGDHPLLLPNYNALDNDGFRQNPVLLNPNPPPDWLPADLTVIEVSPPPAPANVPVVPLDGRPHITFGRAVTDNAHAGTNSQPVLPNAQPPGWEWIGDPAKNQGPVKVRYALMEVALHKYVEGAPNLWVRVAWAPNADMQTKLHGSWAPVPDGGSQSVGQTKLWLWSKTAFDYTRHSGRAWDDWFMDTFGDYPCVPMPPDREICCNFQKLDPTEQLRPPWTCPDQPQFVFSWLVPDVQTVTVVDPVEGVKALCFPGTVLFPNGGERFNEITIDLLEPAKRVVITLWQNRDIQIIGYDAQGTPFAGIGTPNQPGIVVAGQNVVRVVMQGKFENCLMQVCAVVGLDDAERTRRQQMNQHLIDEMARWSQVDNVLEPHTAYRLKIVTTIEAESTQPLPGYSRQGAVYRLVQPLQQVEYAYFRTEGPPGLTKLLPPVGNPNPEAPSGLDDLTLYVRQTVPATVPAPGALPHTPPRPVYCAYDVGVEFNENYVDLMYRLERRDLGLYLYDNNNRPVRDAQGRLIVLSNRWGVTDELTLTESEQRWLTVVNGSDCATLDSTIISHDKVLTSSADGQVLDLDTMYEARLVPLLLHETFPENLAGWQTVNEGDQNGPANWVSRGHDLLEGTHATAAGPVISLDGTPDLSNLDLDFDTVTLNNDTARPSCIYRVRAFDNVTKTLTVDGTPNLRDGSSPWTIPGFGAVVQTSDIWGGTVDGRDPVKPGTMLLRGDNPQLGTDQPDQPGNWTDYRLSVYVRSTDDGAIGLIFRYVDTDHYYRFSMDRARRYRRLVKATTVPRPDPGGPGTFIRLTDRRQVILAEDDFVYRQNQDYLITVEAIGSSLRVYQDGTPVFDVTDEDPITPGRVGLYCWANQGARFSDLRVDDFRREAPVAYHFTFTTSQFANFFHHLHSFQDETWQVELTAAQLPDADIARLVQAAVTPATPPSEAEAHAYEDLAGLVLGPAAQQNPAEVQVTQVGRNGEVLAFLVQSPGPIDWSRTDLVVRYADHRAPPPALPGAVKLTDVTVSTVQPGQVPQPNDESVTLLLRERTDLTGHRIEYRHLPGLLVEPTDDPVLFGDAFDSIGAGSNPLQHYTIVDEGTENGPSVWQLSTGALVQTSSIDGGSEPAFPGTQAVAGDPIWTDCRLTVRLRSDTTQAIGVLFRYSDTDNYYRLSQDAQRQVWQLMKKANGIVTLLHLLYAPLLPPVA